MAGLRAGYFRPRAERLQQNTLKPNSRRTPALDAVPLTASVDSAELTIVFDRPVILRSMPELTGITTDVAVDEVSSVQTADDTVVITFDGSIAAATEINWPNPLPNKIRTRDGGWTHPTTFLVPT